MAYSPLAVICRPSGFSTLIIRGFFRGSATETHYYGGHRRYARSSDPIASKQDEAFVGTGTSSNIPLAVTWRLLKLSLAAQLRAHISLAPGSPLRSNKPTSDYTNLVSLIVLKFGNMTNWSVGFTVCRLDNFFAVNRCSTGFQTQRNWR